jgi:hypothetical protein
MWGAELEGWLARDTALRRYGPWIGLAIAAAAYYRRFAKDTVGMEVYPQAGACVMHGEPLRTCAELFSYPPAFGFLMAPFAAMPMGLRIVVWYLVSLAATVGCFWVCEKLVLRLLPGRWSQIELAWLRIVTVIASLKFVLAVFEYQAYDTLAAFFVFLGLWAVVQNRAFVSGALLALAAAIKATPLVFLPYLVVKRRFVAAAIFVAVFVGLWLLPDADNALKGLYPHYTESWLKQIVTPALAHEQTDATFWKTWMGANILNHSFRGTVARMVVGTAAEIYGQSILYTLCAVYVAFVGLLMLRTARRDDFVAVDGSILAISMLMLSPMTSRYHYILLVLPYMTVIGLAVRDRSLRVAAVVTIALSFILGTATSNDIAGHFLTEWSYQHNFLVLSALVLLAFLAFVVLGDDVRQTIAAYRVRQTIIDETA